MKTEYKGYANKSGVYQIKNILNERIYIGSAKQFKDRFRDHISSLRKNKHQNKFLQADFNKCGEDNFLFEVMEIVEGEQKERLLKEQSYLDVYHDNQEQCYNFDKKTNKTSRSSFSKNPEETKQKLSDKSKEMWKDQEFKKTQTKRIKEHWSIQENREHQSKMMIENWELNDERKQKQSEQMKLEYEQGIRSKEQQKEILNSNASKQKRQKTFKERIETDLKEQYIQKGLEAARKNNERYNIDPEYKEKMDQLSRQNIVEYNKQKQLKRKPTLVGPDNQVYENILNANEFAKQHNLDSSGLYKLLKGILKNHKGFHLYN
jgi:group I intron endonuclease